MVLPRSADEVEEGLYYFDCDIWEFWSKYGYSHDDFISIIGDLENEIKRLDEQIKTLSAPKKRGRKPKVIQTNENDTDK